MEVRKFQRGEEDALHDLFYNTVRQVNCQDYSLEQVQAWAPDEFDKQQWQTRIQQNDPFVCIEAGEIIGYADLQPSGYIDQFYVDHRWQRQGVGRRLINAIEAAARQAAIEQLSANVSITARPFFAAHGFQVEATQQVLLRSAVFQNFKMIKNLQST